MLLPPEPAGESNRWTPDRLLDDYEQRYGGIDAVLLWQGYPNMGADDRNAFDLIRRCVSCPLYALRPSNTLARRACAVTPPAPPPQLARWRGGRARYGGTIPPARRQGYVAKLPLGSG